MTIADTDVLIDYLTGRGGAAILVAAELRRGTLQTTVVTRFELLGGARGDAIGMGDSLIAGIVLQNGGTLMTRNRRHFERVEGLRIAGPEGS